MKTIDIFQAFGRMDRRIFGAADIAKLIGSANKNTVYKAAERLVRAGVLRRLGKGLFYAASSEPDLFEIANHLYVPSYISLESALYRYGVITRAPYTVTSVSPNKSLKKTCLNREFEYSHLDRRHFFGYVRDRRVLIATREKAMLDLLFLVAKKSRSFNFDEVDWPAINRPDLRAMAKRYAFLPLRNLMKRMGL